MNNDTSRPAITIVQRETDYEVVLENSRIRARYGLIPDCERLEGHKQSCMTELLDKTTGYDPAGYAARDFYLNLDNGSNMHEITSARVARQDRDAATAYLYFGHSSRGVKPGFAPMEQEVTMYRDCPVLKIRYLQRWHTFEWCAERRSRQARLAIWGDDQWYRLKGWDEAHKYNWHESGVDNGWYYHTARDGYQVPLNYHGHIIGGVYQQEGRGFLRVFQIDKLDHYLIMPPAAGFETWDNGNEGEFTSYLAPVSGGRDEIFSLGKACADKTFRKR